MIITQKKTNSVFEIPAARKELDNLITWMKDVATGKNRATKIEINQRYFRLMGIAYNSLSKNPDLLKKYIRNQKYIGEAVLLEIPKMIQAALSNLSNSKKQKS